MNKKIKFGKKTIRKYLKGNHYHIIVKEFSNEYISVGLTSDKPNNKRNQKLHKVYESNGKIARLKRNATIDYKKYYHKKVANFSVDIETEKKAIQLSKYKKNRNTN